MDSSLKIITKKWYGKLLLVIFGLVVFGWAFMKFIYPPLFEYYTGVENAELTYESSKLLTDVEFDTLLKNFESDEEDNEEIKVNDKNYMVNSIFPHIKYFAEEGIKQYEGPKTCLTCHETMSVTHANGTKEDVNTMDDITNTAHFLFQSTAGGFSTYGYDGRKVNEGEDKIPVGKIDRACGIPGSFSWTGWAALIETKPAHLNGEIELRSEGCGQCHIGGNYHPATEEMLPIGSVPDFVKDGIDCLICHSQTYDMNYKHVIKDDVGTRWNQDRRLETAMTVTNPTSKNCLNCHQHNMGGDTFADNISAQSLGHKNKRLLHEGSKRANPFSPDYDVHAAAEVQCLDCHEPEGHKIPRGTKGTDLVVNDLPDKKVACENCHTYAPHTVSELKSVLLNGHVDKLACETCHILELEETNVVFRDWTNPHWNEEEGMFQPTDILRSGEINKGFTFLWFNGNGTFLANALGNNPNGSESYNPLMSQITEFDNEEAQSELRENIEELLGEYNLDIDKYMKEFTNTLTQLSPELLEKRKEMIERNIKPLQNDGKSKIYPFKLFNARMYEDMTNEGPFGAMILPFDYATYYQTGKPLDAVKEAISHPIVKRMYETPFKLYMMDEFMKYFGVEEWSNEYPLTEDGKLRNVEARWMRQFGTLMVNHGIQSEGRTCIECHSEEGVMQFEKLGYSEERSEELRTTPEAKMFSSDKEDDE